MSPRSCAYLSILASLLLLDCGGDVAYQGSPGPEPEAWQNPKPLLTVVSPSSMAVGDTLTILGQHFLEKDHGKVLIHFKGTYFDDQGGSSPVDFQATPLVVNSGKLKWDLYPYIVFSRTGDQLGRFVGHVAVINAGKDGSEMYSDLMPATIHINPSLIARVVQPLNAGCQSVVDTTLPGVDMKLMVEAIGLRPGTPDAPLTFRWTFLGEQWRVALNYGTMDTSVLDPSKASIMIEDKVVDGTTSTISGTGTKTFFAQAFSDSWNKLKWWGDVPGLKEVKTGTIPAEGSSMPITANVQAEDISGKSVKLAIKLTLNREVQLIYKGETKLAERMPPVMVSDCIHGGDIGRDVNYHEAQSESRARSMSFNWNVGGGVSVNPGGLLPGKWYNPFALGINFSIGFGVNVHEQVSSDRSQSLSISGHILPGQYGAFYRQTSKLYRIGQLVGTLVCGQTIHFGDAVLTDWIFTPDLAAGPHCPPPTQLQPAQKFLP